MMRYLIGIFLPLILLLACNQSADSKRRYGVKPSALGVMNEIVVVSDEDLWKSVVGDTIRGDFSGFYPLLPRPEPMFDLRHFTIEDLEAQPLKKELRTYLVVANLDDRTSETTQFVERDLGEDRLRKAKEDPNFNTSIGRDKWATGQMLIYIFAHGPDALTSAISRNFDGISSKVNEHDGVQLRQLTYARGHNKGLEKDIKGEFGVDMDIPADMVEALDIKEEDPILWLRKDTKDGAINIAIRKYTYDNEDLVSKAAAKERWNQWGRLVSSSAERSYAVINDRDLPILEFDREIDGRYTKEYRGIWEMTGDFMGGPFVSYAIVHPAQRELIVVDGFVFAPGAKKRDMMQQIDYIAKTIRWE